MKMLLKRLLMGIPLLALLTIYLGSFGLQQASAKDLSYKLYFGIASIGDAIISRAIQDNRFTLTIKARPDGVAKLFSDETWTLSSSGFTTSDGFEPWLYQAQSLGSERRRNIKVDFAHSGNPRVSMDPADKHAENRTPVPEYLLPAARDPLTTALRVAERLQQTGSCRGRHLMYNGIHMFYIMLKNKGPETLESKDGFVGGTAHRCELHFKPVGGYRKKYEKERAERLEEAKSTPPSVWYRALTPGDIPDIIRIEIPTRYGAVTAYLRD